MKTLIILIVFLNSFCTNLLDLLLINQTKDNIIILEQKAAVEKCPICGHPLFLHSYDNYCLGCHHRCEYPIDTPLSGEFILFGFGILYVINKKF